MKKITVEHARDYGCEISEDDRLAYHAAVERAIEAIYPDAEVASIDADVSRTRVQADGFAAGDVEAACMQVSQEVWDRAEFY